MIEYKKKHGEVSHKITNKYKNDLRIKFMTDKCNKIKHDQRV